MASTFPTTNDALTNPAAGDQTTSPSHAAQHIAANDAIEAMQLVASTAPVGVIVYHDTTQSIATATLTALSFNQETLDAYGMHSGAAPTRLTVPAGMPGGVWIVTVQVTYAVNGTGTRHIQIRKNGTAVARASYMAATSDRTQLIASYPVEVLATEYVEVFGMQDSGGNLNTGFAIASGIELVNKFSMFRL